MDELMRAENTRKEPTPAHLVPPAAVTGENTFGFFPSARDIRVSERRKDVKRERIAINKIWNTQPRIMPKFKPSPEPEPETPRSYLITTRNQMSPGGKQHQHHGTMSKTSSSCDAAIAGVENPGPVKIVNLGAYFRHTDDRRKRHFFISPEWISEGVTVSRIERAQKPNPLRYGWI